MVTIADVKEIIKSEGLGNSHLEHLLNKLSDSKLLKMHMAEEMGLDYIDIAMLVVKIEDKFSFHLSKEANGELINTSNMSVKKFLQIINGK